MEFILFVSLLIALKICFHKFKNNNSNVIIEGPLLEVVIQCKEVVNALITSYVHHPFSSTRSLGRAQTSGVFLTMGTINEPELPTKISWGVSCFADDY